MCDHYERLVPVAIHQVPGSRRAIQLIVSLDSADLAERERNRGLNGLERRLAEGIAQAREYGLPVQASVTVSRLVRYDALPETLRRLGFVYVAFSYPRAAPFGSTSLVTGRHAD